MKKILFIYPSMIMGGSTTALISLLNNLSLNEYEIDLQLYRNEGPLINEIPSHVNLLPQADLYPGKIGKVIKIIKFILKGYIFKGIKEKNKKFFSWNALSVFQVKELSKKNLKEYDYAVGFLEGWSNRYLAFDVKAKKKYAWLHSTFSNITSNPKEEVVWMKLVDKIIFVTDACLDKFKEELPEMACKAITIENIIDSKIVRQRSLMIDIKDVQYKKFIEANCFKIITVCRLTISVKGLDRIVNCVKKLKDLNRKFIWYIIGDGEEKEKLLEMIKKEKIEDYLFVIGKRMNPYPFMKEADLMCMPSRYEGKPIAITEGLILGIPSIVTEYLSAHEQIKSNIEGIIVKNNDSSIFEVLDYCVSNQSYVRIMKSNIRRCEYGNKEYIKEIESILFNN